MFSVSLGLGADALNGGGGFDYADYNQANAGVRAGLGNPVANTGEAAGDTYISIEGLRGSNFNDILIGNTFANRLDGGAGNDKLTGGIGADAMVGGNGNDTYAVDAVGDMVTELPGGGTDLVKSSVSFTLSTQVENLVLLGSTNVNGTGNGLVNTITGNSGANTLSGLSGNDTFERRFWQ